MSEVDKNNLPEFNNEFFETLKKFRNPLERINTGMSLQATYNAKKDEALLRTAEASDMQNELLSNQLDESKRQYELLNKQVEVLLKQNQLLKDNYDKLKDMYDVQCKATEDAKADLKVSKKFNKWMMVISVIAMLAAIVSPIVTIIVS